MPPNDFREANVGFRTEINRIAPFSAALRLNIATFSPD